MKNFPERLKSARLKSGLSIQDLVDRLDNQLSKQAISRYENGVMKPNGENLELLCQALGVDEAYFNRDTQVTLSEPSYRKLKRLSSRDQEMILQMAVDHLERYLELESLLGEEPALKVALREYQVSTIEEVETVAERLREKLGFGEDPIINLINRLEEEGIKVVEIITPLDFSGFATEMNGQYPVIVLNNSPEVPTDRKRFTLAHELGHLLLDLGEGLDEEKCCNRFAGALLITQKKMHEELRSPRHNIHIRELILLKEQYGISLQALLYRAKDLEIISDYTYLEQIKMFNRLGIRKQEPGKFNYEEQSHHFMQLTLRGVAEEIISHTKAATLNNMKTEEFTKYFMDDFTKG